MNVYVLFHANCFDGTGAKYAAWKKFGDQATYIPVQYGKPFPSEVHLNPESEIYILDFSYDRETLEQVNSQVGKLVVLDHHKTAQEALQGLSYATFDMGRSGAVMAWEYFHPEVPVPSLLKFVEDGDLWKFSYPETKPVRAALPLLESSMEEWDFHCFGAGSGLKISSLISNGVAIEKLNSLKVKSYVRSNIRVLPYRGFKAGVYNTTTLVSEMGEEVYSNPALGCDISLSYFFDKDGKPVVSFRSKNPSGPDVGALARELGGGGHRHAAGATVTIRFIQQLYQGEL